MIAVGLFVVLASADANSATPGFDLPATFVTHRVFVDPITAGGEKLHLYTDSGGGAKLLCRAAAARLRLATTAAPHDGEMESELGKDLSIAKFPTFKPSASIPPNADGDDRFIVNECKPQPGWPADAFGDGMLSNDWFADRVWTWDYPRGHLRLEGTDFHPDAAAHSVGVAFKAKHEGERPQHFARIPIEIDGRPLDMLLDTGATTTLPAQTLTALNDGLPALRATSFITHGYFEEWHQAHPDWRVIEKGEIGTPARLIEVPKVTIAGTSIGPVWFTERPDKAFHQFMAQMMDKPVEGAVGGNVFSHFVMTIDYPHATAYFRCTRDCGEASPPHS